MRIVTRASSLVLLLLAAVLLDSCRALVKERFKSPKVEVMDIEFAGDGERAKNPWAFTVRLVIENRNPYPLDVVSVAYSAAVGHATLADGERNDRIRVGADGETVVAVPLTLRPEAFKEAGRYVVERRSIPYEFNGSVGIRTPVLGVVRIPFSKSGVVDPLEILKRKGLRLN